MDPSKIRVVITGRPFRLARELQDKLPLQYDPLVCDSMEKVREVIPLYRTDFIIHIDSQGKGITEDIDTDFDIPCVLLDGSVLQKTPEELDSLLIEKGKQSDNRTRSPLQSLFGSSPAQRDLRRKIPLAAKSPFPIMIVGEPGSGKKAVAQILHQLSDKSGQPFVPYHCLPMATGDPDSELGEILRFSPQISEFREGNPRRPLGGTLFLHHLDQLSPGHQARLLKLLTEGLGGKNSAKIFDSTQWRILSAVTHLEPLQRELIHKIGVLTLKIPALREKKEDIPILVRHILNQAGFPQCLIENCALEKLKTHDWPGNISELKNCLLQALTYHSHTQILAHHLEF